MASDVTRKHFGFHWFWYSRVMAQTAQAAILYGLLIYLVAETQSGIWPALFVVTSILPALLFGLLGGVVADWLPQRPFMFALNAVRGLAVIPMLRGDPSIRDVFLLTAVIWIVHQFYAPAESALLPRLAMRNDLPRATARHNMAIPVAQLLGMVILAPLALKIGSIDILLISCAILYLAASVALLPVRPAPTGQIDHDKPVVIEAAGMFRTGWQQMVSDHRAFSALVDSVMVGVGLSTLIVIVPQFLEDALNIGADNTVFVFAPSAVGLVIGLQAAPLAGKMFGHGRVAVTGLGLFCLSILAIGSINLVSSWLQDASILVPWLDSRFGLSPAVSTTMLLSLPTGFAVGLVNVAIRTELILRTAPHAHGRVFSTQMTIANLGALLPTIIAGLLIDVAGVQLVAIIIALGVATGAILGRRIGRETRSQMPGVRQSR